MSDNLNDLRAAEVTVGFHPNGYRIDKNASPMNRYTKWTIDATGEWTDPEPVCFHSMPETGWWKCDHFGWEEE